MTTRAVSLSSRNGSSALWAASSPATPRSRKGYNGRAKRSHRSDDEELYRPDLLKIQDEQEMLLYGHRWGCFYNALRQLGYDGPAIIAAMPLSSWTISALISCSPAIRRLVTISWPDTHGCNRKNARKNDIDGSDGKDRKIEKPT